MSRKQIEAADWRDLPRGHYAIAEHDDEHDDYPLLGYWCYQRKVPRTTKTGREIGQHRLISGVFHHSNTITPEQLNQVLADHDRQIDIAQLLKDPDWYRAEFGRFTGRCGCCGKALTDPDSKMRGIGPECARRAREHPEPTRTEK